MSGKTILVYTDESTVGGVAQYNHVLIEALLSRGWRVASAQPRNASPLLDEQQARGVIHAWVSYEPRLEFQRSMVDTSDPARIFTELKPDLIYFSDCSPISNIAAKHIAIQQKIPFVVLCHSGAAYLAEKFPACLGVVKKQFQFARQVIAISPRSLDILRQSFGLPADKGVSVLNGRPDKFFAAPDQKARARIRAELQIPSDGLLCFTSARFDMAKGYQFQLAAIKLLHDRGVLGPCYFAWAGIGEIHADMAKAIAEAGLSSRIRLLGQRWDITDLLDASDFFALTTINEGGLPLCVMEAMAKGLPSFVTSVSGIPDIVGQACHLLPDPNVDPKETVASLANGLHALSRDASRRKALGLAGRALAEKLFRQETNLEKTLAIIDAQVGVNPVAPEKPVSLPIQQMVTRSAQMSDTFRVSALVSTYKSRRFIEGCLQDLVEQTLFKRGELEIVVIDSCSPEDEGAVVAEFQKKYPNIVYVRTDQRETLYAAWNRGIETASAPLLTNANTDDRHKEDGLEKLAAALDANPGVALAYGDCLLSTVPNERFSENRGDRSYRYPEFFAPAALLHYQFGPQPMWRKTVHAEIGFFDGSMRAAGDYDFNLRFAQKFRALHLCEITGSYLAHEGAISFADDAMARETQQVTTRYRQDAVIEAAYGREGVSVASPKEKALLHLDLGLRALEYFPPWKLGQAEMNPGLAAHCFARAFELDPSRPHGLNNLFCVYAWVGKAAEAESFLKNHPAVAAHPTVTANRKRVQQPDFAKQGGKGLSLMPGSLELRSQRMLAFEDAGSKTAAIS